MEDKMKEVYEKLTPENQNVINLVAKGMVVAQKENKKDD